MREREEPKLEAFDLIVRLNDVDITEMGAWRWGEGAVNRELANFEISVDLLSGFSSF